VPQHKGNGVFSGQPRQCLADEATLVERHHRGGHVGYDGVVHRGGSFLARGTTAPRTNQVQRGVRGGDTEPPAGRPGRD